MKSKTVSFLLLFVYFAVIFQPAFKYAAFIINQRFIVENICVQKEQKDNSCQGSCYLSQEMEDAHNGTKKDAAQSKIEITELILEFLIHDKSDSKQFVRTNNLSYSFLISTINKEYKPLVPPPKY